MGYANPDAMLASMPSPIYTEWQAFYLWKAEMEEEERRHAEDAGKTQSRARSNIGGRR